MDDKNLLLAYEIAQVKHERTVRRLIAALIVAIAVIFACNAIWLYAWMQYDYTSDSTETVTVDGKDGIANYIGGVGSIVNGENSGAEKTDANPDEKER